MNFEWLSDIVKNCIAIIAYGFCFILVFLTLVKLIFDNIAKTIQNIMIDTVSLIETKKEEYKAQLDEDEERNK
jgi:hypothetical protein